MPYMLLIVEPIEQRDQRAPPEGHAVYDRMLQFTADLQARDVLLASDSLTSQRRGKRVQVRDGERRLLDGPFAETKEMIGGFFLVDCATQEEALEIAAQCPAAEWCTVEVRQTGPCWD